MANIYFNVMYITMKQVTFSCIFSTCFRYFLRIFSAFICFLFKIKLLDMKAWLIQILFNNSWGNSLSGSTGACRKV